MASGIIAFSAFIIFTQLSLNYADLTVCDKNDTSSSEIYIKRAMQDKSTCYFVVKNATDRSHKVHVDNTKIWYADRFEYSLDEARRVCCEHNATLPIIRFSSAMQFIQSNFQTQDFNSTHASDDMKYDPKIRGFALGMNISKLPYMWDDGTMITFSPWSPYSQINKVGDFAFMSQHMEMWEIKAVKDLMQNTNVTSDILDFPLGVVCQQTKPAANIAICKTIDKVGKKMVTGQIEVGTPTTTTISPGTSATKVATQNDKNAITTTPQTDEKLIGDTNGTTAPGNNGNDQHFASSIYLGFVTFGFLAAISGNE